MMGHETYGGEEGDKAQENKKYTIGIRERDKTPLATSKPLRLNRPMSLYGPSILFLPYRTGISREDP
jgi:hypothetical protein